VTPIVPVLVGEQARCFRFWKALFEHGIFANPVIPPAVEPGQALLRTSYMATHTDAQLDQVLEGFEKIGRKMGIIPETRPTTFVPVQIARPGTKVRASHASQRWAAASAGMLVDKGFSLERISKMSSREVADTLFDAVELITWRAANLQGDDLKRLSSAPMKLWERRTQIPGILLEKSANLFIRNGKQ
jgi:8-amino-7-oxononanoate synthase